MSTLTIPNNGNNFDLFSGGNAVVDFFKSKPNYKKLTTVKKVMEITTDIESVEASKELLSDLKKSVKNLPKKKVDYNQKEWVKIQKSINDVYQKMDGFLSIFDEYQVNDLNAKKLLSNLSQAKDHLEFISDYFQLVINSQKDIQNLTSEKSKLYSLEEIKQELAIS